MLDTFVSALILVSSTDLTPLLSNSSTSGFNPLELDESNTLIVFSLTSASSFTVGPSKSTLDSPTSSTSGFKLPVSDNLTVASSKLGL